MLKNKPKKQTTYAFIDSQNLNLGVQKMGWKMDWQKFRDFLQNEYNVSKAYMFIGYVPEFEDMYVKMHDYGFLVVLKPTHDMTRPVHKVEAKPDTKGTDKDAKPEEKKPVKGNIDAELVLWAMKELKNYQKAIVVSGDGDFYCLVEYLDEIGKLGSIMTPNWQYSGLLNKYEQYIIRLDKNRGKLEHRMRRKKPRAALQKPA